MRSSELLSDSSLIICFLFTAALLCFFAGTVPSSSESLEPNMGIFLAAVLEEALGLERASRIEGCFSSGGGGEKGIVTFKLING